MQKIPENLPASETRGGVPQPVRNPLETRTSAAASPVIRRPEEQPGAPLPHMIPLTGHENITELLRQYKIDNRFAALYETLYRKVEQLFDDPLAQYQTREQAKTIIRQALRSRKQEVADAMIQALPTLAHHIALGNASIYFNENVAHVFGVTNQQQANAIVQQILSRGGTHSTQLSMLQKHHASSKIQARTPQQSQASSAKGTAAAQNFGALLNILAIELPVETTPTAEKVKELPEEMVEEAHHVGPQSKEQLATGKGAEHTPKGVESREGIEKTVSEKRKGKAQAAEEAEVGRTHKKKKKEREIASERRADEIKKKEMR